MDRIKLPDVIDQDYEPPFWSEDELEEQAYQAWLTEQDNDQDDLDQEF